MWIVMEKKMEELWKWNNELIHYNFYLILK